MGMREPCWDRVACTARRWEPSYSLLAAPSLLLLVVGMDEKCVCVCVCVFACLRVCVCKPPVLTALPQRVRRIQRNSQCKVAFGEGAQVP